MSLQDPNVVNRSRQKRVAIVIANPSTSTTTGWPVGFWWSELTHSYFLLSEKGYEVDVFSPNGGACQPDALSDPRDPSGYSSSDLVTMGFIATPQCVALVESMQEAQDAGQLQIVADKGALVVRAGKQVISAEAFMLRSLFDVMFFAARNTQTPPEHQSRARPSQANGALTIHASSSRPPDAMVWVEYAGHYYSIDNTDLQSKDTFALLMQLSRIQASPAAGSPVLTLPVR